MRKDIEKYTTALHPLLLKSPLVEKTRLQEVSEQHLTTGIPFHELILNSGTLTEEQLAMTLSFALKTPVLRLSNCQVEESILKPFDPEFLLNHHVLPFRRCAEAMLVLLALPLTPQALYEIEEISKSHIFFYIGLYSEITAYLSFYYQKRSLDESIVADPWGIISDDTLLNKLVLKTPPLSSE